MRKHLSTPRIVITPIEDSCFGFHFPRQDDYFDEPYALDLNEGTVLIISELAMERGFGPSSLAHEYRHHWQEETGRLVTRANNWPPYERTAENEKQWLLDQNFQPHELDAIRFQRNMYPQSDEQELLWEWIVKDPRYRK